MCSKRARCIGQSIGDNIVGCKSGINQHIKLFSNRDVKSCKFPKHIYECGVKNKCLNDLFLKLKLKFRN